ncbi:MAG: hypothetical protein CBC22_06625 [Alphaproteobacteria bacterium TMED62]|nr:MAG: hypothetical protein CBC22_06625 [Alphaproteobacteria bacterium TMED62]
MPSDINKEKIEAAVLRKLLDHLRKNTDVQNIDLMNLAGFCRNCLSKWYLEASRDTGQEISYDEAKEIVYSMPYEEWKEKYQK